MISEDLKKQFIINLERFVSEGYSLGYSRYKAAIEAGIARARIWDYARGPEYKVIRDKQQKQYIHNRKWVK